MPEDDAAATLAGGVWLNEPARWRLDGGALSIETDAATDFWRETHYGFVRDSGHFLGVATGPSFTAEIRIEARYERLYDQAGLMVRLDECHWVKAGIELSDGQAMLSSVLTGERSDWATAPYPHDPADLRMRVTVAGGVLRIQTSRDGVSWPLVRLAPFPQASGFRVGPMCCTPERAGLTVRFSGFALGPASTRDLHDLSA